ncbi:electron transport complex subunit RsxG [Shewanella aestuarii]|uniref:Ion-translocating oxidoreductase complex subunit G n=1 Tax=Shewanella aestuarii TaxID=1028752 RepID=A0A6G9QNK9_9GAMM|nr:electron transport complex subunit RsxG [Shewanella aestuarii]QIR16174.1 electron transport complex subunit RsxG [Shewanella aestuarii]
MLKNGALLGLFALLCTGLVAIVNGLTKDTIAQQELAELTQTLTQVIPMQYQDNLLVDNCVAINSPTLLGSKDDLSAYIAIKDGAPKAIAIQMIAPDGYNGEIKLIMGVDNHNQVLGIRTLSHQETPGLGDKIDLRKSDWVLSFTNKVWQKNNQAWHVKKDGGEFDQFTGATITPRAYVKAIRNGLVFIDQNRKDLYQGGRQCGVPHE